MKKISIGLGVLALFVFAMWLAREEPKARATRTTPSEPAQAKEPPLEKPIADLAEAPLEAKRAPVEAHEEQSISPRAHLFGRIVDSAGTGIAKLELTLTTFGEQWSEGVKAPSLSPTRWYYRTGYTTKTRADGSFEFNVPPPSVHVQFEALTPPYLDRLGLTFAGDYPRTKPALAAGDTDLGTLIVQAAGTISGRLQSPNGQPIQDGEVRLDTFIDGRGRSTRTDSDGIYLLEHIPAGTYPIEVIADGYLMTKRSGIDVQVEQDTGPIDFKLAQAPSVAGTVQDQDGQPLENVFITAWPVSSGRGASGRSLADGSFEIFLAQDEPHTFEVRLDAYENPDGFRSSAHPAGDDQVKLRLRKLGATTFVVLDAATDEPIERYGFSVGLQYELKINQHDAGRSVHLVEPGGPVFCIYAPGYARQLNEVVYDEAEVAVMTVRLHPGGSIAGIVLRDGKPSPFPVVQVAAGEYKLDPTTPDLSEKDRMFSDDYGYDLDQFAGRKRVRQGLEDGSFRVDDLVPGTYTVVVQPTEGASIKRELVRIKAGELIDFGTLEAPPESTLLGKLTLAANTSPSGLSVDLYGADMNEETVTDSTGRFEFSGLAAGHYQLRIDPKQGVLARGNAIEFEIAEGESKDLVIDLTARAPCSVSVSVRYNGKPGVGVRARALRIGEPYGTDLSLTDNAGLLVTERAALGECTIRLLSPAGFTLWTSPQPHIFSPGGEVELSVDLTRGTLDLQLPEIPKGEIDSAWLSLTGEDGNRQRCSFSFREKHLTSETFDWTTGRLQLGAIASGTYEVQLRLGRKRVLVGQAVVNESEASVCQLAFE